MVSASETWGTTAAERALAYPCDGLVPGAEAELFRGVDVAAPAATVFRWLCQLRVAPYSYDWIDNLGRQSPRRLIPGLERLEVGQRFASIFRLVAFVPDAHVTLRIEQGSFAERVFGDVALTYLVAPRTDAACRLLVKLLVRYPGSPAGPLMRLVLPWGDLVMMRRQLLNLKELAEGSSGG
jgi:hypothetical protein